MERLGLIRNDIRMPIKKLPEYTPGGRNPDDSIAFIDYNDNVRIAGVNTASRFGGAAPECPGIMLCLPNQEKADKLYLASRNVYIISKTGALYSTGDNTRGQCFGVAGTGVADVAKPTATIFASNCVKVAASSDTDAYSAMVLINDGNVWAAGENQYGQIGDGTTTDTGNTGPKPTLGPGNTFGNPTTPVADVIGHGSYNGTNFPETYCALLTSGAVFCVGYGGLGQVGNGSSTAANSTWQQVIRADNNAGLSNITKISACGQDSAYSFYALDNTGSLWSWGYNGQGQLGVGNLVNQNKATRVTPFGNSNIVDIYPMNSLYGAIIVKQSDKSYWGCGYNANGQLGLGDTTNRSSFVRITSLDNKDVDIVYPSGYGNAGYYIGLSRNTNRIYGTGYAGNGNLGLGNLTTPVTSFTEIPFRPESPIIDIQPIHSAGSGIQSYTLILTADGNTYFAGQSRYCYVGKPDRNVVYFCKNTSYMLGK